MKIDLILHAYVNLKSKTVQVTHEHFNTDAQFMYSINIIELHFGIFRAIIFSIQMF